MYCIIKCPFCSNIQGGQYPVKKTRCHICSKTLHLDRMPPLGVYEDIKEMQAVLISMKWEGEGSPARSGDDKAKVRKPTIDNRTKSRDRLRRALLSIIEEENSRDKVLQRAISMGFSPEDIEATLDELISKGLVISPTFGVLKKI